MVSCVQSVLVSPRKASTAEQMHPGVKIAHHSLQHTLHVSHGLMAAKGRVLHEDSAQLAGGRQETLT